jgi:hypothetical protein
MRSFLTKLNRILEEQDMRLDIKGDSSSRCNFDVLDVEGEVIAADVKLVKRHDLQRANTEMAELFMNRSYIVELSPRLIASIVQSPDPDL